MISVDTDTTGKFRCQLFLPIFVVKEDAKFLIRKLTLQISKNKDFIFPYYYYYYYASVMSNYL